MESEFIYFTIIYSILKQKAEGKWGIREELEQKRGEHWKLRERAHAFPHILVSYCKCYKGNCKMIEI